MGWGSCNLYEGMWEGRQVWHAVYIEGLEHVPSGPTVTIARWAEAEILELLKEIAVIGRIIETHFYQPFIWKNIGHPNQKHACPGRVAQVCAGLMGPKMFLVLEQHSKFSYLANLKMKIYV